MHSRTTNHVQLAWRMPIHLLEFLLLLSPAYVATDYLPGYEQQEVSTQEHFKSHSHSISNSDLAAERYREAATILASAGPLRDTLQFLRSACRLHPTNATYWNDLGVIELRLGSV
jgi:hypothetical protein